MDILIADDDPCCRAALARLLCRARLDVIAQACDGMEALAILKQIRVDLIVTDCQMPRMDGLSLIRHARRLGHECSIVMVSGHTDPAIAAAARDAGADAFFPKPLNGRQFLQFVQRQRHLAA